MDGFFGWKTSSYTGKHGQCVEVGPNQDLTEVGIRDTKNRRGAQLTVTAGKFRDFISGVKNSDGWRTP